MKLKDIYKFILDEGEKNDPRPAKERHKYPDTAVLHGDPDKIIYNIMVGIDIGAAEVIIGDRVRVGGKKIDLILSHHPLGTAEANYASAMHMQADLLQLIGFNGKMADKLNNPDIERIQRNLYLANHNKVVDATRILNIPLICAHTPIDNLTWSFLKEHVASTEKLGDIIDALRKIPEYRHAEKIGLPPVIINGRQNDKVGKFWLDMTGGNPLPYGAVKKMKNMGIDTIIAMHLFEKTAETLKRSEINYIVCGHMASDSLGLNLFLDRLLQRSKLSVTPCGGFHRVSERI
ncbi:MAG: hypothetical protein HYU98_03660 [Deltaproteobacteria bacterium]|nr:hypothetical protein [Deltaproteobacteria bacterium]